MSAGLARRTPAWAITAAFGLLYVILAPPSSDLAAAGYRSELFGRAGFTLWDNSWYGGHHLLAYSLLAPALGWLLGVQLLAALSMTLATALFAALIDGLVEPRVARLAALWFAFGATIELLANREPFELGVALGIGALLAARAPRHPDGESSVPQATAAVRGRRAPVSRALSLLLATLCALASPVAGTFLALAAVAWALGGGSARGRATLLRDGRFGFALALAALVPALLLVLAFPEGGSQPFVASAFYPALVVVLIIAALIPARQRVLRVGALLYAAALLGAYLIPTALGGNVDRLGALMAGPLAACALATATVRRGEYGGGGRVDEPSRLDARGRARPAPSRSLALLVLAPFLIYWQAKAPVADFASARSDPAVDAAYYAPLIDRLRVLGIGYGARPARIEVVPTRNHAEARWLAPRVMIARGWERQLDIERNGLFYRSSHPLTPSRYRAWLSAQAISYVALADAPLDYSGRAESRLLAGRPGYLREMWRSAHWRLFAVRTATALAQPPSVLQRLGSDSFTLRAPTPGTFIVRVHFTPYWKLASGHGCVLRAPGDWTSVRARASGTLRVVIGFSLARVFDHGARCR